MRLVLVLFVALSTGLVACGGEDAPGIPHAISSEAESYCLSCHKNGDNGAPRTPHPDRTGCTTCHSR